MGQKPMTEGVNAIDMVKGYRLILPYGIQPYTPSGTFGATSPYTGEAYASPVRRMKFGASGCASAPPMMWSDLLKNRKSAPFPERSAFAVQKVPPCKKHGGFSMER